MDNLLSFENAISVLPLPIRQSISRMSNEMKINIEEIRLRINRPVFVTVKGREIKLSDSNGESHIVTSQDISLVLDIVTRSSIHIAMDTIRQGFVTMQSGHRIGICGTAVVKDGVVTLLRNYSSLNIRIAREVIGCSNTIFSEIMNDGQFLDTLVISPPGLGKTTLIRDIVRNLSKQGIRTGVADERGELTAVCGGIPQFDLGDYVDVIDGAPKSEAMLMLLKTMSPMVLAVDEITSPKDIKAAETAANCGVRLLASVHAKNFDELKNRQVTRTLLKENLFRRVVVISFENGTRKYEVNSL